MSEAADFKQRLAESKATFEAAQQDAGYTDGTDWAKNTAEYAELRRLSLSVEPADGALMETVWPETFAEFEGMAGVAVDWPKHAEQEAHYLQGFTCGALAAFREFWDG